MDATDGTAAEEGCVDSGTPDGWPLTFTALAEPFPGPGEGLGQRGERQRPAVRCARVHAALLGSGPIGCVHSQIASAPAIIPRSVTEVWIHPAHQFLARGQPPD